MLVEKTEHALNEVKDQFNRPHAQREGNKSWAGQRGFLKKVVVEMGLEERVRWGGAPVYSFLKIHSTNIY